MSSIQTSFAILFDTAAEKKHLELFQNIQSIVDRPSIQCQAHQEPLEIDYANAFSTYRYF